MFCLQGAFIQKLFNTNYPINCLKETIFLLCLQIKFAPLHLNGGGLRQVLIGFFKDYLESQD